MKSENLETIISLIRSSNRKICLFLGAGADVSSGGKLFSTLKKDTIDTFSDCDPDILNASQIDEYFENTIDVVESMHSREVLLNEVNNQTKCDISDGYKMLVLMAKHGIINAVITTNFFDYLERAQEEMRLNVFDSISNTDIEIVNSQNVYSQKALYLKIHGDANKKHISHLTRNEIDSKRYPASIADKLLYHLENDIVIFVGYSGLDTMITNLIESQNDKIKKVFWINPSYNDDSRLLQIFSNNIIYGAYSFDEFMIQLGLNALNNIYLDAQTPTFIYSWLKEKAKKSTEVARCSRKVNIERQEHVLLQKPQKIHMVYGETGMGKTYFVEYYIKHSSKNDILYLNLDYSSNNSIIAEIVKTFGFITDSPFPILYNICSWYLKNKKYLTIIIDAIPNICNEGINELLSFIDTIKSNNNIDFILVSRKALTKDKIPSSLHNYINYIEIKTFCEKDIKKVANCYGIKTYSGEINTNCLTNPLICDLAFCYFSKSNKQFENIYDAIETAIAEKLNINPQLFHNSLINIAQAEYNEIILEKESIDFLFDTGLINTDKPYYFKYELFKNYYLKKYLFRDDIEEKTNISILLSYLKGESILNDLFYNACLVHYSQAYNTNIICQSLLKLNEILNLCCTPLAIKFCKICLNNISSNSPDFLCDSLKVVGKRFNPELIKIVLEETQALKDDKLAYDILKIYQSSTDFTYEAALYSLDRFCNRIIELENKKEINMYFLQYGDAVFGGNAAIKLCKLLYILMRTDLEVKHYSHVNIVKDFISGIASKCKVNELISFLEKYSYNILFNSDDDIESNYKAISYEDELIQLINHVLSGNTLKVNQYIYLISITDDINNMLIFLLANIIVIKSMINNYDGTLSVIRQTLTENDCFKPQNIDFIFSSAFMSLYYCEPKNRNDFVELFEYTYNNHQMVLFSQPTSTRRSTTKKFSEEFDRIFEDGFNPIAFLFYTSNLESDDNRLKQYWKICEELCESGNISKILVVIHAIGQMISVFPREGFLALEKVTKYRNYEIINRGIIRILQEYLTRYPLETREYIRCYYQNDNLDIIVPYNKTKDKMIYSRTLEQLHWVRLLYSFKSEKQDVISNILECIINTKSLGAFIAMLLGQDRF